MKRPILKVVKFGGYPIDVLIAIGAPFGRVTSKLTSMGVELSEEDITLLEEDWRDGHSIHLSGRQQVLYMREYPRSHSDFGLLAHEIFHTTSYALKSVGMKLTESSEEAYAYAIQDLTAKVLGALMRPPKDRV